MLIIEQWVPIKGINNPITFILTDDKKDVGWYFNDENWTELKGPFVSYLEAKDAYLTHIHELDNGSDPEYNEWSKAVFGQAEVENNG